MAIQVNAQNGFSGPVSITAAGLPAGVSASPVPLVVSAGDSGSLTLAAAADAGAGSVHVTLAAVSGSINVGATLALSVQALPQFLMVGGAPQSGFYDESRQLLFVANPPLNEIEVLGPDLSLRSRLMVPQAYGIDQMSDGKTLVVGTLTQGVYTIDEETLTITQHLCPNLMQDTIVLTQPAAMANGKVLFIGSAVGVEDGNAYIVEWNSKTGDFSMVPLPGEAVAIYPIWSLKRSEDHQWAIFTADKLYLYNASGDSFSSASFPNNNANVRGVAANATGTQFATVSDAVRFYDQGLNLVGTVSPTVGTVDNNNAQYSIDGSRLYVEFHRVLDVIDANQFEELGNITTDYGPSPQLGAILLWFDNAQRAFLSAAGGIGIKDCTTLHTGLPSGDPNTVYPYPSEIPLNTSTPIEFHNGSTPAGTTFTFGGIAGARQSDDPWTTVLPPQSSVAGPVDTVFTLSDGEAFLMPQGFAYGVNVVTSTATLLPPTGNPTFYLNGFGMFANNGGAAAVTVGGQAAAQVVRTDSLFGTLQQLAAQAPIGNPGSAAITVSGSNGTGTLNNAVTYIPSASIVPANGLVQVIYDQGRNLVFALNAAEINVLNPATLQWQTPLRPGGLGGSGYDSMTLTPDGSKMLVVDASANTLTIFNPDNVAQSTVVPLPPIGPYGIVATNTGKAFIASRAGVGPFPIEFDLSTFTYTSQQQSGFNDLTQFRGTPDGKHVVAVTDDSDGLVCVWNSARDLFTCQTFEDGFWTEVAITPDGSVIAPIVGGPQYIGVAAGFFDEQLRFINSTVYPDLAFPTGGQVSGSIFSSSGKTLVVPLGDSIEFYNVAAGRLVGRLMTPEALPAFVYPITGGRDLALDPTGQTIFAISASGLTVMKLPAPVDQLSPPTSIYSYATTSRNSSSSMSTNDRSFALRKRLRSRHDFTKQ